MIQLNAGADLDEETKRQLENFKSHLMDAIDEIEKRDIDLSLKYDLDEFKKVHAHFVDILSRMQEWN